MMLIGYLLRSRSVSLNALKTRGKHQIWAFLVLFHIPLETLIVFTIARAKWIPY